MKQILSLILLLISIKSFAQDSNFSIELSYPIITNNHLIESNYSEWVDLGFKARLKKLNDIHIGLSLNGTFSEYKGDTKKSPLSIKDLYIIQPKIYAELSNSTNLHLMIGVGYSLLTYRKSGNVDNGINLGIGISYDIINDLFAQIQYDIITNTRNYTRYDILVFNSDNNIIKIGLGYRL
jgi:hypothetical protein